MKRKIKQIRFDVEIVDKIELARAVFEKRLPENMIQPLIGNIRLYMEETGVEKIPGCIVRKV